MELRQLRYFVAIAEERSFARAAERLWIAQPGLSSQIRRLEAELAVQLLDRETRGSQLTKAGELFLERARIALAAIDAAGAMGRDLEVGVIGRLRLGVATEARWHPTSKLLQQFSREHSGVELTTVEAYGGTLWRDLRDGRLDVLIAPVGYGSADLPSLGLGSEPWVVLVGNGHPLAGVGPLSSMDLDRELVAVTGHRDGAALDRAIEDLLGDVGVVAELVGGAAARVAVAENNMVALTTAPEALPAGVLARRLDPPRELAFELLWRERTPSAVLAGFVRLAAVIARRPTSIRSLPTVA